MNNLISKIFLKDHKIGQESKDILNRFTLQSQDGWYDITIKRRFKKATKLQFRYLFGYVYEEFGKALINDGWTIDDPDEIESICDAKFANKDIINRKTGETIPIHVSKSKFCTLDMMLYVDAIRDFASENMNFFIPDPNPNWKQEKIRLLKEKSIVQKLINDCISIQELDELFPRISEIGLIDEYLLKETELLNQ